MTRRRPTRKAKARERRAAQRARMTIEQHRHALDRTPDGTRAGPIGDPTIHNH